MHMTEVVAHEFSWQAPSSHRTPRTAQWYLVSIGVMLVCVVVALYQGNLLFAMFAVLAELFLLFLGQERPRQIVYAVNERGLSANGDILREHQELDSFAFHDMGGRYIEVVFRPADTLKTYTRILIPRERVEDAKVFFGQRWYEFQYEGGITDVMAQFLGL